MRSDPGRADKAGEDHERPETGDTCPDPHPRAMDAAVHRSHRTDEFQMSKMGRLLDDDEVEFLLHGGRDAGASAAEDGPSTPQGDQPPREVTMRGDLDKINLTDIFQTLAM